MSPTRILVADMPRLVREIVTELLRGRSDVVVIEAGRGMEIPREAADRGVDVVILGRDDPAEARALLETHPRLLVLTVADRKLVAWRHALIPRRECLGELSPAVLAAVIRAPEPPASWWTD